MLRKLMSVLAHRMGRPNLILLCAVFGKRCDSASGCRTLINRFKQFVQQRDLFF
jgi:hypothetical protein